MEISWVSRQGASRRSNNDYIALKVTDDHLSAVIVDASDRGKAPHRLAEYWAKALLNNLIKREHKTVISLLKNTHRTLTPDYLTERASYTLIDLDLKKRLGEITYVGDCRVGIYNNHNVRWINEPHTIVKTFPELDDSYASCLTRVLKARRFTFPDQEKFTWQEGETLMLCTDGYWRRQTNNPTLDCDDASILRLRKGSGGLTFKVESDCDNFFFAQ